MVADAPAPAVPERASILPSSRGAARAFAATLAPPPSDALVMAGEQDVGHAPAAVLGRARVMGILGVAAERRAEGLLGARAGVAERAGELAQHRVADDHRRRLAAGEHVAADRHLIACEVLEDALVEAL